MSPRIDCLIFLFFLVPSAVAIYAQSIDSVPRAEQELRDIANSKLTSYNDDDPRLKTAYTALFLQRYDSPAVWQASISSDLQRRGDKAIPILLELFEENPEGSFREELLFGLENYPSLKVAPILERVRRLVNDEGVKMSRRTNAAVCVFLSKVGTVEDLEILRKIAARDPDGEMGWTASRYLSTMEKRINGSTLTGPASNSKSGR